jgi:hypothetical protein
MLLVLTSLLLIGLVLTADRPGAPEPAERPSAVASRAPTARPGAPAPRRAPGSVHVRLRAHAPEREDHSSQADSVTAEIIAPPPSDRVCPRSLLDSEPSAEALIYALCTLRC